jgi:CheY-like chemotaxis protein
MLKQQKPSQSLNILVADDDEFLQRAIIAVLKSLGHTGVVVNDGEQVLQCVAQRHFDLILLDVMMPNMDGLAVLSAIRKSELITNEHLRIIMITGHAEANDIKRLKEAGADGYISKPIDFNLFQIELRRVSS